MNFYTLTFKKKILLSFLLIFLMIVFMDVMLVVVADRKTTKDSFIFAKNSRIKHFKYNYSKDIDIVFVGSSRTLYHISTNTFLKNSIKIYNLGIDGAQFEDYPTVINALKKTKVKKVIISLSVNRLYDKLQVPRFPTINELKYLFFIDKWLFIESFKKYVINLHTFLRYSEPIYYKVKSTYAKFNFKSKDNLVQDKNTNSKNYSEKVNCKVFYSKQVSQTHTVLKCTNGDGIEIGTMPLKHKESVEDKYLQKFNLKSIQYLKRMINELQQKQISTAIILEPILENRYKYDIDKIKYVFKNTNIIDLTNYKIKRDKWGDSKHLNYKGKKQYSEHLSNLHKLNML